MTFLTIIIPTFNSSRTIRDCLVQLLKQDHLEQVEILCLDNDSSDDTLSIIKEYANRYPFIKCISGKDKGVYDAMNKGIEQSKGEWLYFLGSDDTLADEQVLKAVIPFLKDRNLDIVYGNVCSPVYGKKYDGEFSQWKIPFKNIAHQAIFYRKTVFRKIGDYNLKYKMLADWDLNLRWMINRKIKRRYVDITIANYAPGGVSDKERDEPFYADLPMLLQQYGYNKRNFKTKIKNFIKRLID